MECSARDLNDLLEEIAEEHEEEEHGIVGEERAREVTELAEELAAACRALERTDSRTWNSRRASLARPRGPPCERRNEDDPVPKVRGLNWPF